MITTATEFTHTRNWIHSEKISFLTAQTAVLVYPGQFFSSSPTACGTGVLRLVLQQFVVHMYPDQSFFNSLWYVCTLTTVSSTVRHTCTQISVHLRTPYSVCLGVFFQQHGTRVPQKDHRICIVVNHKHMKKKSKNWTPTATLPSTC